MGVEEYIAGFPDDVQAVLRKVQQTIAEVVPEADLVISYGIPTFKIGGKYVVYFAGWKKHISVYPIPAGDEGYLAGIAPYRQGAGTLKFKLSEPIPYALIKKTAELLLKNKNL